MSDQPTSSQVPAQVRSLNQWQPIVGKSHETLRKWSHLGWLIPTIDTGSVRLYSPESMLAAIDRYEAERTDEVATMRAAVTALVGEAAA